MLGYTPGQTLPPGQTTPPSADGRCSGRYASYWNAFLFSKVRFHVRFFSVWLDLILEQLSQMVCGWGLCTLLVSGSFAGLLFKVVLLKGTALRSDSWDTRSKGLFTDTRSKGLFTREDNATPSLLLWTLTVVSWQPIPHGGRCPWYPQWR